MNSSLNADIIILKCEVVFNRLLIVMRLPDKNKTPRYLEIPYIDDSPNFNLN